MLNIHFKSDQRLPLILQTEGAECGLACIAMIASFYGHHVDIRELRTRFPISLKGASLPHLMEICEKMSLRSRAVRLDIDELGALQLPVILHWNFNHFVVLKSVRQKEVTLLDPAVGELRMSKQTISKHFTGVALEVVPDLAFEQKPPERTVQFDKLVGKVVGLRRSLLQLLSMALLMEALAILTPIVNQWVMDGVIVTGDHQLMTLLGIGLLLLGLTQTAISSARSWIAMYISTKFNMQWITSVMRHLLSLPHSYFESRHIGDIVSRFGTIQTIEQTLTNGTVEAILDGLLAIGTLAMMLIYSPKMSMIALAAAALYGFIKWARFKRTRLAQVGVISSHAKEQTYFLETIRGVRSIKLANREQARRDSWLNLWINATNASLTVQKLNIMFTASWQLLATLERVGTLWIGAIAVLEHQMSIGMLFAYISYKEQFAGRVNTLIDRYVDFKLLSVQLDRLSDIVLTRPEETKNYRDHDLPEDTTLSLEGISFRYGLEEEYILRHADLTIKPGECIAIVGNSGCGKTTAMKMMLGMLSPLTGQVKLGGLTLQQIGLSQFRDVVATVMQDDCLFAGSLYENISFMAEKPDEAWLYQCAKAAGIHDEIQVMPMGYHTLIGDMGTALSGGQKQRVLLARALYRRPQILFLDEATSHLDLENERRISSAIAELNMTRIMIAHRPQTIAIADRVVTIKNGKFLQRPGKVKAPLQETASSAVK